MNKIYLLIGLVSILFIANFVYAHNWVQVTTFTGSGTDVRTTDYFNCTHTEWQINWNFTLDPVYPNYTAFSFYVYEQNNPYYIDHIYEGYPSNTNGTESIHNTQGTFYLEIHASNTGNYSITVEQDLTSVPEFPVGLAAIFLFTLLPLIIYCKTRKLHHYNHPTFVNFTVWFSSPIS